MIRLCFLTIGAASAILVAVAASPLWPATIEDRAEPALIQGPDVRLIRYADAPGDSEPLYTRIEDGRETGFVRGGWQCMDGKLGGAVFDCGLFTEISAAPEEGDGEPAGSSGIFRSVSLPDWAGTPLPTTIIDGNTIHVIVPDPTPETPAPVPVPAAVVLLLSALAGLIVRVSI